MNSNISILGTGNVGGSLGNLFSHHGFKVTWGARDPEKAAATLGHGSRVVSFADAAQPSDIVIVAIPWTNALDVLKSLPALDGKIIIDATNPLNADWSPLLLGQEISAGEEIQRALPRCRVVKAFNTIFADMMTPERIAFYSSDDPAAKSSVWELLSAIGLHPEDAGALSSARWLEGMAHLNIRIAVTLGVQSQRVMVRGARMCHHQKPYGTTTTQLLHNYYTTALARRRRFVGRSNIVKRAC